MRPATFPEARFWALFLILFAAFLVAQCCGVTL
jgi:hypothetical protein